MATSTTPTSAASTLRTRWTWLVAALVALASLLVLAAAASSMTASFAAGLYVGAIVGGAAAIWGAQRKSGNVRALRRQADEDALDRLEPLRPNRSS